VFKNAQGKFDGRIFIGVMLGSGTIGGGLIKAWYSYEGEIPPFWLWGIPGVCVLVGAFAWVGWWRKRRELRARLERSAAAQRLRRDDAISRVD